MPRMLPAPSGTSGLEVCGCPGNVSHGVAGANFELEHDCRNPVVVPWYGYYDECWWALAWVCYRLARGLERLARWSSARGLEHWPRWRRS